MGRRKIGLLAGFCLVAGTLVYLLAFSLPVFLLASILAGAGRALLSGSLEAWFVDASLAADREADLQAGLAQGGAAQIAGMGTGLLAGGSNIARLAELDAYTFSGAVGGRRG